MKNTIPFLLILLIASTLLLNCNCKHVCTGVIPVLKFVNYDSATLNDVILKQYLNNGQFNTLQATTTYTSNDSAIYYPVG